MRSWQSSILLTVMVVLFSTGMMATSWVGSSSAQQTTTHIVQIGEQLTTIAAQYGVSVESLAQANGLSVDATLVVGQQLTIPAAPAEDAPALSPTPRTSTADDVSTDVEVIDTRPTDIPRTPVPTPLPYDPSRIVSIIDPPEGDLFRVDTEPVLVRGVVQFDPATMAYWKMEIRGPNRRSRIWQNNDPEQSVPAVDWVTLDDIRTDAVIDGRLGLIPGFPTLNEGRWDMRVVVVGHDGQFVTEVIVPFRVRVDLDAVNASITRPAPGQVLQPGDALLGTLNLNFAVSSYRIELIGGNHYTWHTIAHVVNDRANPINIHEGVIGALPAQLIPGRYRVRLIVNGLDSNYIQDPFEVEFAVLDSSISNLPEIDFTAPNSLERRGRIRTTHTVPITGTVKIPDPNGYFKVDIRDAYALPPEQPARFTDWTTIGQIQRENVVNGVIGEAPGITAVSPGDYLMRVAIVTRSGEFSDVEVFTLEVQP